MRALFRRFIGEPLKGELAEAFARETAEVNRRRLRFLAPLMALLHIAHVAHFWVSPAERLALGADVLRWRQGLCLAHGLMLPLLVPSIWALYRSQSRASVVRFVGPLLFVAYLAHGAVVSGLDQIVAANISAYVGYCFGIAVVLLVPPLTISIGYALGTTMLVVAMMALQRSSAALATNLPTCASLTVVSMVFAWHLWSRHRRDFQQRTIIERQGAELAALNTGLERRVAEQVTEIVARATEVEQLNAQLQAQVRARSGELSLALAKLAQERGTDGSLRRGMLLGGRFLVEESIGCGGMGAVYAGVDQSTGARVAIKVVQATSWQQLDGLRRFLREAGAAATVTHPAVVRMLHVDVSDDGMLFQVQELVDGETLTRQLGGPWPPGRAARFGALLCEALAAAHAEGVVHRDVKPDNVMLTTTAPGLKLLDFGVAKLYDAVAQAAARGGDETTRTGMILGTPAYMAPEQVAGKGDVTDRADVYSVGIILFRMLSGHFPFEAATPKEMMMRHVLDTAPDVRSLAPSTPEPLAQLVAHCLGKEAATRPTARALAQELGAWANADGAAPLLSAERGLGPGVGQLTLATPRRLRAAKEA